MPEEKTYPLSDEARAEWERVWGRRYTTDYAPWEQRCAKMILDMDNTIRELQAENKRLREEIVLWEETKNEYMHCGQREKERRVKAEAGIERLGDALEEIKWLPLNTAQGYVRDFLVASEVKSIASAALAETRKCLSCSGTGKVIVSPGDMTEPCACDAGKASETKEE